MVVGDVIADIDTMLTATTLDFQPAAGVEVLITSGTSDDTTAVVTFLEQTDGTIRAVIKDLVVPQVNAVLKLFINNTIFVRRNNAAAGSQVLGFSGIQTNA